MFNNFIDNAYRCADLDDSLLSTLHKVALGEEYRLGGGDRTIAKGYNELWTMYAQKFRELIKELGTDKIDLPEAKKERARPRAKAEPSIEAVAGKKDGKKKDAAAKPEAKAKPKAKPKPKAEEVSEKAGDEKDAPAASSS